MTIQTPADQIREIIAEFDEQLDDLDITEEDTARIVSLRVAALLDLAEMEKGTINQQILNEPYDEAKYAAILQDKELTSLQKYTARKGTGQDATSVEYQLILSYGEEELGLSRTHCQQIFNEFGHAPNTPFSWTTLDIMREKIEEAKVISDEVRERLGIDRYWEPTTEEDIDKIVNWELGRNEELERLKAQFEKCKRLVQHDIDWIQRRYYPAVKKFVEDNSKTGKTFHFAHGSVHLMDQKAGYVLSDESWGEAARQKWYAELTADQRKSLDVEEKLEPRYKHKDLQKVYKYIASLPELPKGFIKKEAISNKVSIRGPKVK